jgi:hypothetical protein
MLCHSSRTWLHWLVPLRQYHWLLYFQPFSIEKWLKYHFGSRHDILLHCMLC